MLEFVGQFVDGLKFTGGSESLMPKSFIKEATKLAHEHDIYVSTGDWAEYLLQKGPSSFKEYIEVISYCHNSQKVKSHFTYFLTSSSTLINCIV